MENKDLYIEIAGVRRLRYDTSALEGWLMMHSLRRVICSGEDFPLNRGKLGIVASDPLMQKDIDFRDLAVLYGVPVKRLNEQVKRNQDRFPSDFMFQLSKEDC